MRAGTINTDRRLRHPHHVPDAAAARLPAGRGQRLATTSASSPAASPGIHGYRAELIGQGRPCGGSRRCRSSARSSGRCCCSSCRPRRSARSCRSSSGSRWCSCCSAPAQAGPRRQRRRAGDARADGHAVRAAGRRVRRGHLRRLLRRRPGGPPDGPAERLLQPSRCSA